VTSTQPRSQSSAHDRFSRRFVIGFAIVEAIIIGWALLSGRLP
jgi:hypothetical protein